jgi:pimeloyl-ACP methyl ester carboxylesterase
MALMPLGVVGLGVILLLALTSGGLLRRYAPGTLRVKAVSTLPAGAPSSQDGGASSLAFAARLLERLRSLALVEPAWIGEFGPEDAEDWAQLGKVMCELPSKRMQAFLRWLYYALGSLSNRFYERAAMTLAGVFSDLQLEVYEGRSHLDPPHRAEPERFARALRRLWARAESADHV